MAKKVLLYSGGMDSWIIDKLWMPDVKLFFNIGTHNSNCELMRVRKQPDVTVIDLPLSEFEQVDNNYFLPLRNLHFVTYAAHYGDEICLGATGSSTHRDKNDVFATLSENLLNYLLFEDSTRNTPIKVVMPFRGMSKTEILAQYLNNGGDLQECYENTFSCYNPDNNGMPCMKCSSCLSKFTAFYNNGYQFDSTVINQFVKSALSNPDVKPESKLLAIKIKYKDKIICVDFDNTVTEKSKFPITGNLRKDCKERLLEFKRMGYYIIIYTAREGIDYLECKKLCKEWNLPVDEFIKKPFASKYIDDKAVTFTDSWYNI